MEPDLGPTAGANVPPERSYCPFFPARPRFFAGGAVFRP